MLLFPHDLAEFRQNFFYRSPLNGTCEVVESFVDEWACCQYTAPVCHDWCFGTSCSALMAEYDGSRDPYFLDHLGSASQPCCAGSCCTHETCVHTRDDDDDHGHWRQHRALATKAGAQETLGNFVLQDSQEGGGGGGEDTSEPLEGSTTCSCDTYGTDLYYFTCSRCYAGVAKVTYVEPGDKREVGGATRSSDHSGSCSGSTSLACAQDFVDANPRRAKSPCWFDPAAPSSVIMHRGFTVWRWLLTGLFFVCCCAGWCCSCSGCCCAPSADPKGGYGSFVVGDNRHQSPVPPYADMPRGREYENLASEEVPIVDAVEVSGSAAEAPGHGYGSLSDPLPVTSLDGLPEPSAPPMEYEGQLNPNTTGSFSSANPF